MKTRHDEMQALAEAFDVRHPMVWLLFSEFTSELIERGFEHYSAKGVFERIRWETAQAQTKKSEFKLNNNYSAYYARKFMTQFPDHEGFFRTRRQVSKGELATGLSELGPDDFKSD